MSRLWLRIQAAGQSNKNFPTSTNRAMPFSLPSVSQAILTYSLLLGFSLLISVTLFTAAMKTIFLIVVGCALMVVRRLRFISQELAIPQAPT
jgi:hypothetical protein